jgi:uncharacterized RDD family membrane protein YckC
MSDPTAVVGRRIIAYLIDLAVGIAVFTVLFLALAQTEDSGIGCDTITAGESVNLCFSTGDTVRYATGGDAAAIIVPTLIVWLLNAVVVQGATGASIGKHVMRLRVVNGDGSPHGLLKALGRWAMLFVDNQPCGVPIVGFVCALASRGHRRVGDMVLGTYVVDRSDAGHPVFPADTRPGAPGGYGAPPPGGYGAPPPGGYGGPPPGWPPTPQDAPPPPAPGGGSLPPPPPPPR